MTKEEFLERESVYPPALWTSIIDLSGSIYVHILPVTLSQHISGYGFSLTGKYKGWHKKYKLYLKIPLRFRKELAGIYRIKRNGTPVESEFRLKIESD